MNWKSIANLDRVNLENCDSEPIHIPGSIQPHGFLLAVDEEFVVRFCSDNVSSLLQGATDVLNKSIEEILGADMGAALRAYILRPDLAYAGPHIIIRDDRSYSVIAHRSGGYWIIEFELTAGKDPGIQDVYLQTRNFTELVRTAQGLRGLCQSVAEEIRSLTGYDRVMVYKFDEQYNGEIFAESKIDKVEPFLGLHYPHTDIPVQARMLYMTNLVRMIGDVNYTPVPIITAQQQATHATLDLGQAVLRSVSPIHVEYLQNMGVGATLTISLIKDERLWGLIACHHYSAHVISHHTRLAALLQGHFLTSQIPVQEAAEDYRFRRQLDAGLQSFLQLLEDAPLNDNAGIVSALLAAVPNANGVCLVEKNATYVHGDVPPGPETEQLLQAIEDNGRQTAWSANAGEDFGIPLSGNISGFLYYKMDAACSIIWFRNELVKEIHWAGDPAKAIEKDEKGLSPRKSFATWKEVVSGFSSPWLPAEIDIANQCVYAVQKHISIGRSKQVELHQHLLLHKLRETNEELENLNWISTHDFKEPLRKISVFSSLLLDPEKFNLEEDSLNIVQRMARASEKMLMLIDDLMSYSRIRNIQDRFESVDINALIDDVLQENGHELEQKNITVKKQDLPVIRCIPLLMRQLFSNLIANAVKFSRTDIKSEIKIGYSVADDNGRVLHRFVVEDNGIGFDNAYSKLIFQVFQRLDKALNFRGTGIGLAICKKIVDLHKGTIEAHGEINKGARFTITIPDMQP